MTAQPQPNTEPQPRRRADLQAVRVQSYEKTSAEQKNLFFFMPSCSNFTSFLCKKYGKTLIILNVFHVIDSDKVCNFPLLSLYLQQDK